MATATFWGIDPGSCREAGIEGRIVLRLRFLQSLGWPYISEWLDGNGMDHVSGAPYHPQTQGKIGRWHQTLKNRLLLENYFLPSDLKAKIEAFITHYNLQRYHESLCNLTLADVYFGRGQTILLQRERIERRTFEKCRLHHRKPVE